MKKVFVCLSTLCSLFIVPASAGILYTNGPVLGTGAAWNISYKDAITNSFTSAGDTATGFDFVTWALPGDSITSVDWSIGTSPFASDVASGTASGAGLTTAYIGSIGDFGLWALRENSTRPAF